MSSADIDRANKAMRRVARLEKENSGLRFKLACAETEAEDGRYAVRLLQDILERAKKGQEVPLQAAVADAEEFLQGKRP